jgi:hypothetical protein
MMRGLAVVYILVVGLMALIMTRTAPTPPPTPEKDGHTMTIEWSEQKKVTVPARPDGLWTPVFEYVKGPAIIKVEAKGQWSYSREKSCGPDGDRAALLSPDQSISPANPIGALLVKIGGSTAGAADGTVSVVGSMGVVQLGANDGGPLFLTMNDALSGFGDNGGTLEATVSVAPLSAPATAAPAVAAPPAAAPERPAAR